MRIDFIQGIIKYPSSGNTQLFLNANGNYVSFDASAGPTDITLTYGTVNYLVTEATPIVNAWGPLPAATDAWLYWDIDLNTAVRTFGFSLLAPTFGTSAPSSPAEDQHWFDTVHDKMYVYHQGHWIEKLRVFAAKANSGLFTPLGSAYPQTPFAGSQVGVQQPGAFVAGRIIVDNTGFPIRKADGTFFTTEDEFFTNGSPINAVRYDSAVLTAVALEPAARFQVVKFSQFGEVNLATYNDTQTTAIAMELQDVLAGQVGSLCMAGVVTNPSWNWPTVGAPLWIHGSIPGTLTTADPHVTDAGTYFTGKPPVARVISPTSIYFDQGLGGKGDKGDAIGASPATTLIPGLVRVSVAPSDALNPIAVETTDARLSDARAPLPHTQQATTINITPFGSVTGPDVQSALQQLNTAKLSLGGGTMTGLVVLSGDPTVPLGAATKQYVDTLPRTLASQTDVVLTSPQVGQVLSYSGTKWINANTVSTVAVTPANGITASITNPGTTPNIALGLGAITPTSVATSDVTLPSIANYVVSGTSLTTALHQLDESLFSSERSGITAWNSLVGPYWNVPAFTNQFQVLVGGYGFIKSKKITWTAPQTVLIPAHATSLIYVDVNGVVSAGALTPELLFNVIPLFLAMHDGNDVTVVREDHDYSLETDMVSYLHNNVGTIFQGGGAIATRMAFGTGTAIADRQIKVVGADILADAEIETVVPDSGGLAVAVQWYYLNASNFWTETYPVDPTQMQMVYNNLGTLTPIPNGLYSIITLYATKDNLNTPTPMYIAVIDTNTYPTLAVAENDIALGLHAEATNELDQLQMAQLGYAIVLNNASGGYIQTLISARSTFGSRAAEAGGANTATLTVVDSTQFSKILNSGDTTVQSSLVTLDQHTHAATDITTGVLPVIHGGTGSITPLNNNRVMQSTAGVIVEAPAIAANRALISDGNGIPTHSTVTTTTLNYMDATSSVQTQLNTKAADVIVVKKDGSVIYTANQPMGGFILTGLGQGINPTDSVNKAQLDAISLGFSPQPAIHANNLISDNLTTAPVAPTPVIPQSFIAAAGATAPYTAGHLYEYQGGTGGIGGTAWYDLLGRPIAIGDRFGINFENLQTPTGSFVGFAHYIATVTNATPGSYAYSFQAPVSNWLVLVDGTISIDSGHSYAYNNALGQWVEISAPVSIAPGAALSRTGSLLNVNVDGATISVNPGTNSLQFAGVGGYTSTQVTTALATVFAATNLNTASAVVKRDASGNFSAGTITANLTGNASGSAASFTGVLAGDVTGTQGATVVASVGGSTASNINLATIAANAATNANTFGTIVKRDASGNFTATNITANITGNVSGNATNFTGTLGGDVTGTQAGTVVASVGGSTATLIHSAELAANAATNLNTASTIVKRDASGNFTAGTVTANLIGNVTGNTSGSAASFTGNLAGDVTGPQGTTVVATVGGSTAANVHAAELAANAATSVNTASTIVKRDSAGNFTAGAITATTFNGTLNGTAASANNFTGGTTGAMHYQSAPGTTAMLAIGLNGQGIVSNGTLPAWSYVTQMNAGPTGAVVLSSGTSAQRPGTPAGGNIRYNTDLNQYEGYYPSTANWSSIGGGATGGGTDQVFFQNSNVITASYTIPTNMNAMTAGPVTINSGVVITVPTGSVWTIV